MNKGLLNKIRRNFFCSFELIECINDDQDQGSTNFFWKGLDLKNLRLAGRIRNSKIYLYR